MSDKKAGRGRYILDDAGKPVLCEDLAVWAKWFEASDRQVGWDEIGGAKVSTIFLALDLNVPAHGPPLLFETMIFGGEHAEYQKRYATREEAERGHAEAIELVRKEPTDAVKPETAR